MVMKLPQIGDSLPKRGNKVTQYISTSLMSAFGWRLQVDIPDVPKLVLVGAPHTSNWDFIMAMLVMFALGVQFSWMAKHSLFKWPFRGFFEWLGGIPINRDLRNSGIVQQTIEAFNSKEKLAVAIMPEGTRTRVKRWKTGFYHIAQGANVPIVLVKFDYGRKILGVHGTDMPTGDLDADLDVLKSTFAKIKGKCPHQF